MPGRSVLCRLLLVCAALGAPRAHAQAEIADLREDVRGLNQRLGELSLRLEQLEHENAELRAKVSAGETRRDLVTATDLDAAKADLNASLRAAVTASRSEILDKVATQMENLAKQTNAALDSIARREAPAPARTAAPAPLTKAEFGTSYPKEGINYTVQKGDSIGIIAKKTGAKSQDIIDANKLTDPSRIQAGQVLVVPGGK